LRSKSENPEKGLEGLSKARKIKHATKQDLFSIKTVQHAFFSMATETNYLQHQQLLSHKHISVVSFEILTRLPRHLWQLSWFIGNVWLAEK